MSAQLPRLVRLLIRACTPRRHQEFLIGDLTEGFNRARVRGRVPTWVWLVRQVAGSVAAVLVTQWRRRRRTTGHDATPRKRGDSAVETLFRDLRFSIRTLSRQPGYTVLVLLTLSLGIGANVAIFSVVNAVLLRQLPYPEADRLVTVSETVDLNPNNQVSTSYRQYVDYRTESTTLEALGATVFSTVVLTGDEEALRLNARFVSPVTLQLLGARTRLGRTFGPQDDESPGSHPVAILSNGLWERRFGSDSSVVGQTIHLDNRPYLVVGVMEPEYRDLSSAGFTADIWMPIMMAGHVLQEDWFSNRLIRGMFLLGRVKAGESVARADQELQQIAAAIAEAHPESNKDFGATVVALKESVFGNLRTPLVALLVGASFLLVVACANVASLVLVRSASRKREIAMRLALGASRPRLIQLLTTEALVLGLLGGAIGVGISMAFLDLFMRLNPVQLPTFTDFGLDGSVLAFSLGTSVAASLVFGLVPAIQSSSTDLRRGISDTDQRSGGDRSAHRTRGLLVMFEVAVAVVLLVGSGLMIRSFAELRNTDMGFRIERVMTLRLNLSVQEYASSDEVYSFIRELNARANMLPGVEWAGTWGPGIPGQSGVMTTVIPEGRTVQSQLDADLARFHHVGANSLQGMEFSLLAGRLINEQDRSDSQPVVVISKSLADLFWPNQNPLGRQIRNFRPPGADPADFPWFEVVGVVADANLAGRVSFGGLRTPHDIYLSPEHRNPRFNRSIALLIGTVGEPANILPAARQLVRALDPNLPVFLEQDMTQVVRQEEQLSQFTASLMGTFGSLSLFLAALGIYGVLSQTVTQRAREIGLRIALGAAPAATARLFVGHGFKLVMAGALVGLAGAFGVTRFVSSLLYGVQPTDPVTMGAAVGLLLLVALVASYLPTRRALRVDPMLTLRGD